MNSVEWVGRQGPAGEPGARAEDQKARFRGQWYDAETGWHYNPHRYYDPELGRYLSPDPIAPMGGLNEYAYVPSPLEWDDPEGLTKQKGEVYRVHKKGDLWRYQVEKGGRWYKVPKGKCAMIAYVKHPDGSISHKAGFISGVSAAGTKHREELSYTTHIMGNHTHTEPYGATKYMNLADSGEIPPGSTIVFKIKFPPCERGATGGCAKVLDELREYMLRKFDITLDEEHYNKKGKGRRNKSC